MLDIGIAIVFTAWFSKYSSMSFVTRCEEENAFDEQGEKSNNTFVRKHAYVHCCRNDESKAKKRKAETWLKELVNQRDDRLTDTSISEIAEANACKISVCPSHAAPIHLEQPVVKGAAGFENLVHLGRPVDLDSCFQHPPSALENPKGALNVLPHSSTVTQNHCTCARKALWRWDPCYLLAIDTTFIEHCKIFSCWGRH